VDIKHCLFVRFLCPGQKVLHSFSVLVLYFKQLWENMLRYESLQGWEGMCLHYISLCRDQREVHSRNYVFFSSNLLTFTCFWHEWNSLKLFNSASAKTYPALCLHLSRSINTYIKNAIHLFNDEHDYFWNKIHWHFFESQNVRVIPLSKNGKENLKCYFSMIMNIAMLTYLVLADKIWYAAAAEQVWTCCCH